jgi:hypothetical protein
MAARPQPQTIESAARGFLKSAFLAERAARVAALGEWMAGFAELRGTACDRRAIEAAAWFQDSWCGVDLHAGRFLAPLVLSTQPTEWQREQAADIVQRVLAGVVDGPTREVAARAIREAGRREITMPEAMVLAEATNLDSIGPLWLCGEIARCMVDDRQLGAVVATWQRQLDYQYWAGRIAETLRFARSRQLARHRRAAMEPFMAALRDQLAGGDRHVAPEGA